MGITARIREWFREWPGAITVRGTLTWGPRPVNKVIKVDVVHKAPGRGLTRRTGGQTQQRHAEAGVAAHLKCGERYNYLKNPGKNY